MPSGGDTAMSVRAAIAHVIDKRAERVDEGHNLLKRATALGDPTARYEALVLCASVATVLESDEKAIEYTEQAMELLHGPDAVQPAEWAKWRMPYNQAFIADSASRFEEGERYARLALAAAVASGHASREADATALLSWLQLQQGQAVQCVETAIRAIRLGEPGSYALGYGYFNLALVLDAHGASDEAIVMMQQVIAVNHDNRLTKAIDILELSRIAANAGRVDIVADCIQRATAIIEAVGSPPDLTKRLRTARGRERYVVGDFEAAERILRPLAEVVQSGGYAASHGRTVVARSDCGGAGRSRPGPPPR
ncbi:MAG: hypothetical protein R2706_14180 [Acidimicrobiales bacterium]